MTTKSGSNLGLMVGAAPGEAHYAELTRLLRGLDGLVQPAVSSRVTALPTSDMLEGDRYLFVGAGTNANKIARYREASSEWGLSAGWEYFTPREGWYVWSVADKRGYRFSNGGWIDATFQGGTLSTALNEAPIVGLASAATLAIGAALANTIQVTGTIAITAFDTIAAGARRTLRFADALTLTHSATSLILPRGANVVTVAGDVADFVSLGGGNWVCVGYQRATATEARTDIAAAAAGSNSDITALTRAVQVPTAGATDTSQQIANMAALRAAMRYYGLAGPGDWRNQGSLGKAAATPSDVLSFGLRGGLAEGGPNGLAIPGLTGTSYGCLTYDIQWTDTSAISAFCRRFHFGDRTFVSSGVSTTAWSSWREVLLNGSAATLSTLTCTTGLNIAAEAAGAALSLSGAGASVREVIFKTLGSNRFGISANSDSESGNNAGSNLTVNRYNDSGAYVDQPLRVERSTGETRLTKLQVSGATTLASSLSVTGPSRVGQYTLASLPSASAYSGYEIDVTDASGGPKRCRSNGTDWQILNTTTKVS